VTQSFTKSDIRISSSFVDFDSETGEPVLETPYYHYDH
jgi:hypothetical protein